MIERDVAARFPLVPTSDDLPIDFESRLPGLPFVRKSLPLIQGVEVRDLRRAADDPPLKPSMLPVADDQSLLYGKGTHDVHGVGGAAGKTWLLYFAIAQELSLGRNAMLVDFESSDQLMIERFRLLGVDDEVLFDPFRFVCYTLTRPFDDVAEYGLKLHLDQLQPTLAGVDSLAALLGAYGADENLTADARAYYEALLRVFDPTCLVVLDHVGWDPVRRAQGARGSSSKRDVVDVSLNLANKVPFSRSHEGYSNVVVRKDRNGWLPLDRVVGEMHVLLDPFRIEMRPPSHRAESTVAVNAGLEDAVLEHIEQHGPVSGRQVTTALHKRSTDVQAAVRALKEQGLIEEQDDGWVALR